MKHLLCLVGTAVVLTGCSGPPNGWSDIQWSTEGDMKMMGTRGFAMGMGKSGQIQFELGPEGSHLAPPSPEVANDNDLSIGRPVGVWVLERDGTRVTLPRDERGTVKIRGYANTDAELWGVMSAPGCFTLTAAVETGFAVAGPTVQKTYRVCDVDKAAELLKKAKRT